MNSSFDEKEKLELVNQLIVRFDTIRANTANRCAIILSGNAFLLAAILVLMEKTFELSPDSTDRLVVAIVYLADLISIFMVFLSCYFALRGLAYIWTRSDPNLGIDAKERVVYHASSTLKNFNYINFKNYIKNEITPEKLLDNALTELWNGINAHHERYSYMQEAAKILANAFIAFLTGVFILILINLFNFMGH